MVEDKNIKTRSPRITEAQLFHFSNHHKWLSYKIIGGKTVKTFQVDPQTKDIWPK